MRLLSIDVRNIRSYRAAHVEFPSGVTLLSGDIGSGKSTILIAVEFALFGLSRSELVGGALLRHGAADGSVNLRFSINDMSGQERVYGIFRALKRAQGSVVQDNGWLESEGTREALTPSELRARVFELLGYPLQFLGKQRNLLYRFTIYTPQEEMKAILAQDADTRVETIRRLFALDAYRIARDNAQLVAKALRDRETATQALVERVTAEERLLVARLEREPELLKQRTLLVQERIVAAADVQLREQATQQAESARAQLQQRAQALAMQERTRKLSLAELAQLSEQLERRERQARDATLLSQTLRDNVLSVQTQLRSSARVVLAADVDAAVLAALDDEAIELDATLLAARISTQMHDAQQVLDEFRRDEGRALVLLEQSRTPFTVAAGAVCPTCKQAVTAQHVEHIQGLLDAQGQAAQRKHGVVVQRITVQRERVELLRRTFEQARQLDDVRKRLQQQEKVVGEMREGTLALSVTVVAKREQLAVDAAVAASPEDATLPAQLALVETTLTEARRATQVSQQRLLEIERRVARLEQEAHELEGVKQRLLAVQEESSQLRQHQERDVSARSWLTRQFVPFASNVERHVLHAVHASFDAAFRQWFSRLIEDDALGARLDHEFTPIMLQNGYETDIAHLSGGERTSVSLAYRLALVHAIHLLSPHLGTAGLILLDEPTDGFSSEQLERVRDVLQELKMDQVIIVSHEQQLEGFVDHILRVRRAGDGSVVEVTA